MTQYQNDILPAEIASTPGPEDRSGPRTTEFWISLLTILASLVVAFRPTLASKVGVDQIRQWATIAAGLASVGYAVSRAITKHGSAKVKAAALIVAYRPLPPVEIPAAIAPTGGEIIPPEVDEPADATLSTSRPLRARRR